MRYLEIDALAVLQKNKFYWLKKLTRREASKTSQTEKVLEYQRKTSQTEKALEYQRKIEA